MAKLVLIWSLLVGGSIEIGLAIPMILHKVPPNVIYGFRTQKTLSDKEIWYKANEFSGKLLLLAGIIALILAGILWWLHPKMSFPIMEATSVAGIFVPLVTVVTGSFLYLRRL